MRYINLTILALYLFIPAYTYAQPPYRMYGFIGGGIGHQFNNVSTTEKITLNYDLTESWLNRQIKRKDEFWHIAEDLAPDVITNRVCNQIEKTLHSHAQLKHLGIGYPYTQHVTFEFGLAFINSNNCINPPFQTQDTLNKQTTLTGITFIQKTQLFSYARWRTYAQLGGGLLWGYTTAPFLNKKHLHDGALTIPKTPSILCGIGTQYPIFSFADIDIAWTHLYVKNYYHFNFFRVALNFHQQ